MKIIQLVTARQSRGAELSAAWLSEQLVKKGVEVRYISLYHSTDSTFSSNGLVAIDLGLPKKGGLNWSLVKSLKKALQDFRPDIVQANAGDTLKYAVLVRTLFGLRYKIVFRNASMVSNYIRSFPQRMFNGLLYKRTDYVLSVSRQSREDLIKLYPVCEGKSRVVPNGILTGTDSDKRELGSGQFHVLHIGGFTFEKNHEGLLRIFAAFLQKKPEAYLHLVGDGPLKEDIEKFVSRMGLEDHVTFYGFVTDPLSFISGADMLVLPSVIEGLPAVVLEAMYGQKPVVAYNVGGIAEAVSHNQSGILSAKDDEQSFVTAMHTLSNDPALRQSMGRRGRTIVEERFTMDRIAEQFMEVYEQILG
ncbi:MAG: glycosyltransferase [Cyclobacteriaceae bacterium]|nr:glycosyltransferase [Cyclobacteriaceae bacterium]